MLKHILGRRGPGYIIVLNLKQMFSHQKVNLRWSREWSARPSIEVLR